MTLRKLVLSWNNSWKYDLWYRRKYNIRFNSPEHRETNQLDIAREYLEYRLEEREKRRWDKRLDDEKFMKDNEGQWLRPIAEDEDESKKLFDAIDINNIE